MLLTVARIGRAHGLRGEVALDVRTDAPEDRLAAGVVLRTEPEDRGPLTITGVRVQQDRWYVTFAEAGDRTAVDGTFTGLGRLTVGIGELVRKLQTGYARQYAATMLLGLVVLAVVVLAPRI